MAAAQRIAIWPLAVAICLIGAHGLLNSFETLAWLANLIIITASIYASRKNSPVVVIILFNLIFNFYALPYIFFPINLVSLSSEQARPYLSQTLWIISLFWSTFSLFINKKNNAAPHYGFAEFQKTISTPVSDTIFFSLIGLLLFSAIFLIKGEVVIGVEGGYSTYTQNLQHSSGIQEYLIIPLVIAGITAKDKLRRIILYITCAAIAAKLSLVGMRIVALMYFLLILWFISPKLTWKSILPGFFLGYTAFSALGLLKGSVNYEEIMTSLFFEMHGDTVVSHHGNVLWASSVMLKLINEGILDASTRFQLLIYYILNTFTPSGILQQAIPNLASWLQEAGYTSGGGHVAVFTYVAGGGFGTIFIAYIFAYLCNQALSEKRKLTTDCIRIWYMVVIITFPRWVSYDLGNFFFRLPIYAIIFFVAIHIANHAGLSTRRISKNEKYIDS